MREQWGRLIEKYLTDNTALRLMVIILDARHDPTGGDLELIAWVHEQRVPYVLVLTKSDKVSNNEFARQSRRTVEAVREALGAGRNENSGEGAGPQVRAIRFSAQTGQGRNELTSEILAAVAGRSS
jgi:GTP-binding protein